MPLGPMSRAARSIVLASALLGCGSGLGAVASEAAPYGIAAPLLVRGLPDNFVGFGRYFSQHVPVIEPACEACLGVHVLASRAVASAKVERVAGVLAQYLDNDEDGLADNPSVAAEMDRRGALMVLFANPEELEEMNFTCGGYVCQDDFDNETGLPLTSSDPLVSGNATLGQVLLDSAVGRFADEHLRCVHNRSVICDAALEEAFHLLTCVGHGNVYPKLLGMQAGSALSLAMMGTIGNCGYNTQHTPLGKYSRFHYPNCTGSYHYNDDTCSFACLVTEYLHHLVASYNGEYTWGRADLAIPNLSLCGRKDGRAWEWENCVTGPGGLDASRKLLEAATPDGLALLLEPAFKLPLVMPTGKYSPHPSARTSQAARHLRGRPHRPLRIEDVRFVLDRKRP